ncbi:type II toxin-antitoxin system PemI/MazE family antitoxin [Xylocopilactobacillus apis]|uniref:Transcription elongation factor GreAB n=1 Tax=Xylocopilactobacillus apis TaxID=2932183 RepID=A0AAU9DQP6_9LACO|nr:transcription elongation factor GreAB [Xylocopilactobacillus apis]BDR57443.1 hypothetical protein KIMC2_20050 [Xylocopilactobacillus apis]
MFEVKTIKRGNSLALSLPSSAGFKPGQTWLLIPNDDGNGFILVPKLENSYKDAEPMSLYSGEEWTDIDFKKVE